MVQKWYTFLPTDGVRLNNFAKKNLFLTFDWKRKWKISKCRNFFWNIPPYFSWKIFRKISGNFEKKNWKKTAFFYNYSTKCVSLRCRNIFHAKISNRTPKFHNYSQLVLSQNWAWLKNDLFLFCLLYQSALCKTAGRAKCSANLFCWNTKIGGKFQIFSRNMKEQVYLLNFL